MLELIYLPNCNEVTIVDDMPVTLIVTIIMMVSLSKLGSESERIRILGQIRMFLGLFLGVFPMFRFINVLFFCNATVPVDTSYFWLINLFANMIIIITVFGFMFGLWQLRILN